ncbi:helix-turn-helix domain-containing protein [Paraburkholderia sp. A1RI-2L]|uniref:helix-turn-helix domain-containing protein n=1 Tax=Paraburkholderia sp. A1RI-2L TaxID=3028367 RepID=UPI003B9E576A
MGPHAGRARRERGIARRACAFRRLRSKGKRRCLAARAPRGLAGALIDDALSRHHGNVSAAARDLGLARNTAYRHPRRR